MKPLGKNVLPYYIYPVFLALGIYSIFWFADKNGLRALAKQYIEDKILPGTKEPLRTEYTGVQAIDHLLTVLTTFFWPALDASHPALLLHTILFAGAFGSAWILVVLESWRNGNARTAAAFSSVFGVIAQTLTFGIATPMYCALQLLGSATSEAPTLQKIAIPHRVLTAIPLIFILGYIIPSILTVLPAPKIVTFDQKQILIAIWQPWPLYISAMTTTVYYVLSSHASAATMTSPTELRQSLRRVYSLAFGNAAVAHVAVTTISLAALLAPGIFNERFVHALQPQQVFATFLPHRNTDLRIRSVGEGVHIFLRWDFLIGTTALLLWAVHVNALARYRFERRVSWFPLLWKTLLYSVVVGPVAAAVELVRDRDEMVLEDEMSSPNSGC